MSSLAPTQTPSPEIAPSMERPVSDVGCLDVIGQNRGAPYVAGGRFQINEKLHGVSTLIQRNQYSVVYDAIDLQADGSRDEPDAVVKVLMDRDMVKASYGTIEMSVAQSLPEHENIVSSLGHGEIAGKNGNYRFLAFEKVNFGTLESPKILLSPDQMVEIVGGVARGLAHLAKHNLVHHDIKPENIGLHQAEDGRITAKIFDFSAARPVYDEPDELKMNHPPEFDEAVDFLHQLSKMQASEGYTSPEVELGRGLTNAADIYALGRTLVKIYGGSDDIGKYDVEKETGGIQPKIEATPLQLRPYLPARLVLVASDCLGPDPGKRIQAQEVPGRLAA